MKCKTDLELGIHSYTGVHDLEEEKNPEFGMGL